MEHNGLMAEGGRQKSQSLDALTGLRFLAAFVVLICHTVNASWRGQFQLAHYSANAVAFFFVLSGFILTYVYFDRLTKQNVLTFYRARWARIWPLHVACLVLAFGAWYWTANPARLSTVLLRFTSSLTLTQSWVPIRGWANWFNGPSWSVSTELGFYVVFPFLLWMGRKRFWPVLLIVTIVSALAVCFVQFYVLPNTNVVMTRYLLYINPISRVFDFTIGMMFGKIFLSISKSNSNETATQRRGSVLKFTILELVSIVAVCVSLYLVAKHGPISSLFGSGTNALQLWLERGAGSSLAFGALLLVFGFTGGLFSRILSSATAIYLGEISYALYLVQNPVMLTVKNLPATPYTSQFITLIALNLICFGLAIFLHHWIEKPCRKLIIATSYSERWQLLKSLRSTSGKWFSNRAQVLGAVGIFVAVTGLFVSHQIIDPEQRMADEATRWTEQASHEFDPPIEFAGEAKLNAFDIKTTEDSIDITIVWEVLPTQQRVRIFHIVDKNNKVVRQKIAKAKLFAQRGAIVDRCSIKQSELPKECRVGIVFYAKGMGSVRANRGSRSMGGRRLEFFKWNGSTLNIVDQSRNY